MKKVLFSLITVGAVSLFAADGASIFEKCATCHGKDGKKKALGASAVIAGQDAAKIVEKLKGYKAGTLNKNNMGGVMKGQAAALSEDDMKAVADYISKLK
jgi:cytochrome c553